MKRVGLLLVLLTPLACMHRSPEAYVLAAFRKSGYTKPTDFEPRDTLASRCGEPTAHVASITGDTAIVSVFQDCIDRRVPPCPAGANCMYSNAIRLETDYLVVRRNGKWKVDRPVAGGTLIGV